jgi:hypothetical protein
MVVMRKAQFLLFVLLFGYTTAKAQTLSPGDIAIIGVNADNPDLFGFVALVDLPAGTVIGFVDHGWQASGAFRTNEDEYTYTATGTVTAGTVIQVADTDGAPRFSASGDQLIAFQGTVGSPTHIYAVNFEGSGWQADATSSNTSALPAGLVNGSTAVAIDECDNIAYSGATSGSRSDLLTLIGDKSNWTCDNSNRLSFITSFSVTGASSNNLPEFTTSTLSAEYAAGDQVSLSYQATDADSDPITYGGITLPSGASIDPVSGLFTWTLEEVHVGSHTFSITASDGTGTAAISVMITVTSAVEARRPRLWVDLMGLVVEAGADVQLLFQVKDPEGGPLTYSIEPSNVGATIGETTLLFVGGTWQVIEWTTPSEPGIHRFEVTVTDNEGLSLTVEQFVAGTGTLFPGETNSTLLSSLQSAYSPAQTLGYDVARDTMYSKIDLEHDGFVRGIYTGFGVEYTGADPSSNMFAGGINAEHTWPQSMGAGSEPQRSDMHFLFPAKDNVNSTRSNHPYEEIPDDQTTSWFMGSENLSSIPSADLDEYSEFASGRFEPRESVKGDVARAAFYFNAIYESAADRNFFASQKATLGDWNALDAPTGTEITRSGKIRAYQGNTNPFLLDPSLPNRLFELSVATEDAVSPVEFTVGSLYPNPARDSFSLRVQGTTGAPATISLYDILGRLVSVYEASDGTNTINIGALSPGLYLIAVEASGTLIRKHLVKAR